MFPIFLSKICLFGNTLKQLQKVRCFYQSATALAGNQKYHHEKSMYRDLYNRRIAQGPEPERPRSVWTNWNYESELFSFGARLGEKFNKDTLRRVFTHRSYVEAEEEKREALEMDQSTVSIEDNTHFIQTGEELIDSFIKACLRKEYPALPEDCICSVAGYLTSDEMLSHVGSHIGVRDLVMTAEFPVSTLTLARSFKAVVGGLLQHQGESRAQKFVQDFVLTQLIGRDINELLGIDDPMGLLAAILHTQGRGEPEPRLMYQSGSETMVAVYMVGVYCDKHLIGKSYGETIGIAEDHAARDALRCVFGTTLHRLPARYSEPIQVEAAHYTAHPTIAQYKERAQTQSQTQSHSQTNV